MSGHTQTTQITAQPTCLVERDSPARYPHRTFYERSARIGPRMSSRRAAIYNLSNNDGRSEVRRRLLSASASAFVSSARAPVLTRLLYQERDPSDTQSSRYTQRHSSAHSIQFPSQGWCSHILSNLGVKASLKGATERDAARRALPNGSNAVVRNRIFY